MFAALAYSMILADTFQSLFVTVGWNGMTRTKSLLSMTSFLLLPLCWMKNLNSLAPFSLLGTLGMALTTVFMAIRYFQKAYLPIAGKAARFLVSKELAPSFGSIGIKGALSPNSFILISMLSTAYLAHFNAAKFYTDQQGDKTEKIARFNKVVSISFAVSIAIFCAITSIGYLSFGASSNGFILNNYSTKDSLMSVSRIAVALSLVFS
jgi:amino acid permease